jgi:hypothetical protein
MKRIYLSALVLVCMVVLGACTASEQSDGSKSVRSNEFFERGGSFK